MSDQDASNVQYHIEIQEGLQGNEAAGEIMVVLDLGDQELPADVAQTIMELAQSRAPMYQDINSIDQSGTNEVISQEDGTFPYTELSYAVEGSQVFIDSSFGQQQLVETVTGREEGVQFLTFDQDRLIEHPVQIKEVLEETPHVLQVDGSMEQKTESVNLTYVSGTSPLLLNGEVKDEPPDSHQFVQSSSEPMDFNGDLKTEIPEQTYKIEVTDQSTNLIFQPECETPILSAPIVLECDHCPFTSESEVEIGRHVKSVHKLKKPYKCYQCSKMFEKELSLQIHSLSHSDLNVRKHKNGFFLCPLCDFECRLNKRLVEHFDQQHSRFGSHKLYSCALCKFACLTSTDFDNHVLTSKHKRNMCRLKVCPLCSLACMKLEEHMNSAHGTEKPYLCNLCGYTAKVEGCLKAHMLTHIESKDFICPTCQAAFKSSVRLNRHMKLHDPVKKYKCMQCPFSTNSKYDFTRHMQRVHTKKSAFSCKTCQQVFSNVTDLKLHSMSEHHSKDSHYCEYCDFSCVSRAEFRIHMQVHTDKHRFFCTECDFSTPWKCHFNRHRSTHSNIENKPYVCHICNYSCFEKMNLKKHMVVHSSEKPFSCNLCDYKCKLKNMLNIHNRVVHSDLRPFSCDYCKYTAKTPGNLKKHMWIHEQFKPFQCPHCTYACREGSKLRRHISKKHKTIVAKPEPITQAIHVVQVYTDQHSKEVTLDLTGTATIF